MSNDESRRDARGKAAHKDWRHSAFLDRESLINEIHKRQPFPLRKYARVTHTVRVFPSLADATKETVADRDVSEQMLSELADGFAIDDLVNNRAPIEAEEDIDTAIRFMGARKRLQRARQTAIKAYLARTSPFYRLSEDEITPAKLSEQLSEVRERFHFKGADSAARKEIDKFKALYDSGGPLELPEARDKEQDGRTVQEPLAPFHSGGAQRKLWLNLWRDSLDATAIPSADKRHDIRLAWELYSQNQTFTFFEDANTTDSSGVHDFFENIPEPTLPKASINTAHTAIDAFEARLRTLAPETAQDFAWVGDLLSVSHTWLFPIEDIITTNSPSNENGALTNDDTALLWKVRTNPGDLEGRLDYSEFVRLKELLVDFAKPFFGARDETRADWYREDFIMSRICGDRAILLADLRPHSRMNHRAELASRIVILDLGLSAEQRGRVLKRICDLATYRMLGLRDYSYFFSVQSLLADISVNLDELSGRFARVSVGMTSPPAAKRKDARKKLEALVNELIDVDSRLSSLNFFITGGITASAKSTETFLALVEERGAALRENRLPGYQTVTEYLKRFEGSARNMVRISESYELTRTRVADLLSLARAEMERVRGDYSESLTARLSRQTGVMVNIGALAAVGAAAGVWAAFTPASAKADLQAELSQWFTNLSLLEAFGASIAGVLLLSLGTIVFQVFSYITAGIPAAICRLVTSKTFKRKQ